MLSIEELIATNCADTEWALVGGIVLVVLSPELVEGASLVAGAEVAGVVVVSGTVVAVVVAALLAGAVVSAAEVDAPVSVVGTEVAGVVVVVGIVIGARVVAVIASVVVVEPVGVSARANCNNSRLNSGIIWKLPSRIACTYSSRVMSTGSLRTTRTPAFSIARA